MMKKYRVIARCTVEVATMVKAENEEEAIKLVEDRDVNICIHGSEIADHETNEDEFCLVDGCSEGLTHFDVEDNN